MHSKPHQPALPPRHPGELASDAPADFETLDKIWRDHVGAAPTPAAREKLCAAGDKAEDEFWATYRTGAVRG